MTRYGMTLLALLLGSVQMASAQQAADAIAPEAETAPVSAITLASPLSRSMMAASGVDRLTVTSVPPSSSSARLMTENSSPRSCDGTVIGSSLSSVAVSNTSITSEPVALA